MTNKHFSIQTVREDEHDELLDLWEASVRATHTFLKEENILFFKRNIHEHRYFELAKLNCIHDTDGHIIGFMGTDGDSLEMLFVHPNAIGTGVGKALLVHAIETLKIKKVDVNEQNEKAFRFYEKHGFSVAGRSDTDGTGKPFPILHLELA